MTSPERKGWRISPPSAGLGKWVSLANQLVQILALIVGGVWAYTRFIRTEEPAQRQNFTTEQEMKWADAPGPSACYAILGVTFQNISRSEVPIEKVIRRAWVLPLPSFDGPMAYIDPERLANVPATDSTSYTDGPFVQTYPPQAKVREELVWMLRRAPGLAVFRIDLFADSTDTEPTDWIYDWDEVCGGENASSEGRATSTHGGRTRPDE